MGGFRDPQWLEKERALLRRVRSGDRAAFAQLYEAFAAALYDSVLLPALGERAAAEDALAETFGAALERLGGWKDRGVSIWFWLKEIAMNKARDAHRARARSGRALTGYEALLSPLRESATTPEAEVGARQAGERLSEAVRAVLRRIHPRYGRALELRLIEGRPRPECAEALDVSLGTFDVLILRALRAFRAEWDSSARKEVDG